MHTRASRCFQETYPLSIHIAIIFIIHGYLVIERSRGQEGYLLEQITQFTPPGVGFSCGRNHRLIMRLKWYSGKGSRHRTHTHSHKRTHTHTRLRAHTHTYSRTLAHAHAQTHTHTQDRSGSTCCPSNCMKNGHEGLSSRTLGSFRDLNTMATKGCSDLQDLVLSSHTESLYFVRGRRTSNRSPGL